MPKRSELRDDDTLARLADVERRTDRLEEWSDSHKNVHLAAADKPKDTK